jgi:hypothetical protein
MIARSRTERQPVRSRLISSAEIPATAYPRIAPAFLEEERRQMGDWWFRQEYLCEFVATTDQVFAYDLVMGALSDTIEPLFPVIEGTRRQTGSRAPNG